MTAEGTGPTTPSELNAELVSVLRRARDNGIDVKGGWECRNSDGCPDWDIVITEVQKPSASD